MLKRYCGMAIIWSANGSMGSRMLKKIVSKTQRVKAQRRTLWGTLRT